MIITTIIRITKNNIASNKIDNVKYLTNNCTYQIFRKRMKQNNVNRKKRIITKTNGGDPLEKC